MSNDEAIEEFDFFNEGDYITREMSEAKDIVLKELQDVKSDLYEANKRIADLLLILGDRDRMIDKMAEDLKTPINSKEWIIEYYKKRCENAKD